MPLNRTSLHRLLFSFLKCSPGTSHAQALLHYYDKKTGKKSRRPPQFAKKGQKIIALLETAAAVCVERFADHPQLGRFTLRDEGKTVAIGKITKLIQNDEDMPDVAGLSVA